MVQHQPGLGNRADRPGPRPGVEFRVPGRGSSVRCTTGRAARAGPASGQAQERKCQIVDLVAQAPAWPGANQALPGQPGRAGSTEPGRTEVEVNEVVAA